MKKVKNFLMLFLLLSIFLNTIAYAGLATQLAITSDAKFVPQAEISITDIRLSNTTNGATIQYETVYDSDDSTMGFILPNSNSTITYEVTVTNNGNVNQTIYDLIIQSTNDNNINYSISGYDLKEQIEFKSSVTFYITFSTSVGSSNIVNYSLNYDYRKLYIVEYDANNGENAPSSQTKYEGIDLVITKDIPTKNGYMFMGWTDKKNDGTIKYEPEDIYTLDEDILLYAVWESQQYTITLDDNEATTSGTTNLKVKYNSSELDPNKIVLPQRKYIVSGFETSDLRKSAGALISSTEPLKSTYKFNGWYNSLNEGEKIINDSEIPQLIPNIDGYTDENKNWINTSDQILYAHWISDSVTLPTITNTGYTCGWTPESEGTKIIYNSGASYTPISDIVLYAICISNSHILTVNPNGGIWNDSANSQEFVQDYNTTKEIEVPSTNSSYTITYDENNTQATIGTNTAKAYRQFTGWSISGGGSITTTKPISTSNQTYTYGIEDGTLTAEYDSISNNTELTTISKSGYTCTWNTKADGTGSSYISGQKDYKATNDVILYANCIDDIAPQCTDISISDFDLNSITINATCSDEGTNIKNYKYSVDDSSYVVSDSNTHKFDSIHASTIKINVEDNIGNSTEYILSDEVKTKFYEDIYTILNNSYEDINNNKFLISHPVGSIYITTNENENTPSKISELYGGEWEVYSEGRKLVGYSSTNSKYNDVELMGGSETITLSVANIAAHTHTISHTHTTPKTTISSSGAHTHSTVSRTITSGFTLTANKNGVHTHDFAAGGNAIGVDTTVTASTLPYNYGITHTAGAGSWYNWNKSLSALNSSGEHRHTSVTGSITIPALSVASSGNHQHTIEKITTDSQSTTNSGSVGDGESFSNLDPYITVYMYKRIG